MTSGVNDYLSALEETRKNLDSPVRLSNYNASSRAEEEIIKQNNVIIQMLIYISNRLNQHDHKIKLLKEEKDTAKIDSLISQISNLKLGETSKQSPKKDKDLIFGKIGIYKLLADQVEH